VLHVRSTAGWLGLIVFTSSPASASRAISAVSVLLPRWRTACHPSRQLENLQLPQEIGPRPDRQDRARALRRVQARGRHVRRDPADPRRRDDGRRGQDVLGERRLRPGGHHRGRHRLDPRLEPRCSTITQQLVRAKLLDPNLVQDPERTVERKLKEIIQSIRLTQGVSDGEGKQRIITAYLNNNYYGNQSYGVKAAAASYFGKDAGRPDTGRGRDAGGAAAVAVQLRPRAQRRRRPCDEPRTTRELPRADKNEHLILEPDTKIAQRGTRSST
jgi:hypothetical protein